MVNDGYSPEQSPDGVVRFLKGEAKIDLLAPDGLGADPVETGRGRVVQAPGATQAVERPQTVTVDIGDLRFEIRTPSLLGALIAKSAAAA